MPTSLLLGSLLRVFPMIMAAIAESVLSSRERTKLCRNGFTYDFDKFSLDGSLKFWRCERSRKSKDQCKDRLHTIPGTNAVVAEVGQHNHAGDAARKEVLGALEAIRERAVSTQENTNQVKFRDFKSSIYPRS